MSPIASALEAHLSDDERMLGRLGSYEITGIIGSGGMGIVLKGHDRALDRFVAIKLLSPHLASSGAARQRFLREAKAAAAVVHDNVIAIHGVDEFAGLPYLVMPYCRGTTLEKRIRDAGPMTLREILRVGLQTARGLAAAHAQGLVHRDVKPANILLEDGVERVRITDFGLARAADDASLTVTTDPEPGDGYEQRFRFTFDRETGAIQAKSHEIRFPEAGPFQRMNLTRAGDFRLVASSIPLPHRITVEHSDLTPDFSADEIAPLARSISIDIAEWKPSPEGTEEDEDPQDPAEEWGEDESPEDAEHSESETEESKSVDEEQEAPGANQVGVDRADMPDDRLP